LDKAHTGSFKNPDVSAPPGGSQRLAQYGLQAFLTLSAESSIKLLATFAAENNDVSPRRWAGRGVV
jgi:hypothetical protein